MPEHALVSDIDARVIRVTASQHGALGLGLVDETDELQASSDAAVGGILEIGAGIYLTTAGAWRINPNTRVEVHPDAVFKPTGDSHAVIFDATGTPGTTYPLTANAVEDAMTVTVSTANAAAMAAGQMVTIRDPTTTLGGVFVQRESNVIDSINTGTGVVTLKYPVAFAYTTAQSSWIAPVTPAENVHWVGGTFDMTSVVNTSADNTCVYADWALKSSVTGVTGTAFPHKVVTFHGAVDSTISKCNGDSPSYDGAGEGYTAQLIYCRNSEIKGGWGRNVRHHADISGGQDCHIIGGFAVGRTTTTQAGAFLHGLRSKRCSIRNFVASNVETGVAAGNGSFDWDKDFTISGCVTNGCDLGYYISNSCTGWKLEGDAFKSVIRGLALDGPVSGEVDVRIDGITTNPSNYGAFSLSGAVNVRGKVKVRNAHYRSIYSTSTGIVDLEVDVDHPDAATDSAVVVNTAGASSVHSVKGKVVVADAAHIAVSLTAPAGATTYCDADVSGTALRCVSLAGGATDQTVGGGRYRGTFSEQIRFDAGELVVRNVDFASGGTFIRTATSATKVTLGAGNIFPVSGTRLSNALGATVVGGDRVQSPNAGMQTLATNADFTLDKFAPPETHHTGTLTADRTVTLGTTDMHNGCRFYISRSGAGAFDLNVGTGPLKAMATGTWAEFRYNGSAWVLWASGTI
jgi:hypothetical protein